MLDIIESIVNLTIYIACSILIFQSIRKILVPRWKHPVFVLPCLYILMVVVSIVVYPDESTGLAGCFLLLMAAIFLFFKNKWYLKLSVTAILFPIIMAVSYVTQDIGSLVWEYIFHKNMHPYAETFLHSSTLFLRIPIYYFIHRCLKNWLSDTVRLLTPRMWFVLDLVSLTSFISIISVIYSIPTAYSYAAYPTCIASLITSLGCFYLCTYMSRAVRADMELQAFQYQTTYYQEIERNQQTVRKLRHDMKNHLNIVTILLREQKAAKAEEYLNELNQEFAVTVKAYCINPIVNAVLSSKEQLAADAGIACDFQIDFSETPKLNDIDLCTLFANTLDNSIEACKRMPDPSKCFINVKARCAKGFFSYKVVNTHGNDIIVENGNFITSKKDASLHGIGLKNVKQIVEKYHGYTEINYGEDNFTVTVLI